jgi:hypothetical protein
MKTKLVLGVIVIAMLTIILGTGTAVFPSYATPFSMSSDRVAEKEREAPVAISGDNMYVAWFTNEGTVNSNFEVGFRATTDGGATFGPITNLSNTNNSDSINTNIVAEGGNVIVSWWERNQTAMVPVVRVSLDNGQTFGPRLNITANPFGTIGSAEE